MVTVAPGVAGWPMLQVLACIWLTRSIPRLSSSASGNRSSRAPAASSPPSVRAYQAMPCTQPMPDSGSYPAPSSSTTAPGTTAAKSSFGRSAAPGSLASSTCMSAATGQPVIDQALPFQCSIRVLGPVGEPHSPAAQQLRPEVQATPRRKVNVAALGLGLGTIAHFDPFQCSVIVIVSGGVPRLVTPLAQQSVALAHETADKEVLKDPVGNGALTCDHFDPFQRTENGSSRFCEWLNNCQPTARQSFAETQVTPSSSAPLCGKWIGLGLGTTDQVLPFQRSMSASPRPCASEKWSPTATQSLAPAHHTPC